MNLNQVLRTGFAVLLIGVCLAIQPAQAAAPGALAVSLSAPKHTLGKSDDVILNVSITNTSASPQYLLKWHTPFGEIEESLFEVTRDGVKVDYLGAHYKRPAPTASDYYLLKPGVTHVARVELSGMYDMSITGDYVIRYSAKSMSLFGSVDKSVGAIESETVSIWIDGRLPRGATPQQPISLEALATAAAGLTFNKCTASQQSTVTSAVSAGLAMASDADAYMANGAIGSRYVKWFGVNNSSRVATVKANFVAIKDAFANKPITVDCGCKKPYYAYVYPTRPYVIYVCKVFWTAPLTGTDSKGGTLVHEMSHFNAVAGTDDWVYGQSGAASLAISDPAKAIDNADSHEYFGENTPALN